MELELSISQKQILSQRLQLSVQILQMNALDLDQYIKDAALENPLIELDFSSKAEDAPFPDQEKQQEWLERMDAYPTKPQTNADQQEENDQPLYEKHAEESLYDVLFLQLPGFHLMPEQERAVWYIIGNLDENGYLSMNRSQLCRALGLAMEEVEQALDILHRMDPPGVGAENLRECLHIQAARMEAPSPILLPMIDDYLEMLAKNQLDKLAKALQVSMDDVKYARSQLLTLNPKPGNGYSSYKAIPYIRPDFYVIREEEGFVVVLNDYNQPHVGINTYYRDLLQETETDVAKYIKEKIGKAEWLASCIQQRKSTMLKCAEKILERQTSFFEHGVGHLVPMTLSDIADDLELHVSTVSRAIHGKYLQCQWGIFALNDLFSRSIHENREESQDMLQRQIRQILAQENPKKPLSDQAIADQMNQNGIQIARRTVSKYREQMQIPPASGRKKF